MLGLLGGLALRAGIRKERFTSMQILHLATWRAKLSSVNRGCFCRESQRYQFLPFTESVDKRYLKIVVEDANFQTEAHMD